jgi:sec-independent protein translocase protein TatA
MFGYSWGTILIILVIVLILFGPRRLPELGDSIGKAIRSFKKAHEEPEPPAPPKEASPPPAPGAAQARSCPQCHKNLTGDYTFCPHCGQRLGQA